jgi:hypothetical protein
VYGGDFVLERSVGQPVAFEGVETLELGGNDEAGECLAAAAYCYQTSGLAPAVCELSWGEEDGG